MIRQLICEDKAQYLSLINSANVEMTDDEFKLIYDRIRFTSKIYVYIENNIILGCATVLFEQKFINNNAIYAHIEDVLVKLEHRGKGIGKKMISYIVDICEIYNVKKIILNCGEIMESFYAANGFVKSEISMSLNFT